MRKFIITLTFFAILWSTFANTVDSLSKSDQIRIYSGFRFGFGGAKQRNTIINGQDGKFLLNPNMGAVLWVRFREHIGIMAEVNYSMKGIRFKNVDKDTINLFQRKIHYFEFPILLHASIGTQRFTEFVEIGIAPSYISGFYDEMSSYVDKEPVKTEYQEYYYNKPLPFPTQRFDISVLIGAGLSIKLGPGILHTGFRTNIGLLDIYRDDRIGDVNQNQRQFNFQVQFGYLWHIKSFTK
jgi:hypothetical protein